MPVHQAVEDPIFTHGQEREVVELSKHEKTNHTPTRFYSRSVSIPEVGIQLLGGYNKFPYTHTRDMNLVDSNTSLAFCVTRALI